jgi:hypothetical protein
MIKSVHAHGSSQASQAMCRGLPSGQLACGQLCHTHNAGIDELLEFSHDHGLLEMLLGTGRVLLEVLQHLGPTPEPCESHAGELD